jgi:TolB-like protein
MKRFLLTALFVLISSIVFSQELIIVVAPFDVRADSGFSKSDTETIEYLFVNELSKYKNLKVLDQSDVMFAETIKRMEFELTDWSNPNKVADFGRAINANAVVLGRIMTLDKEVIIAVRINDLTTEIKAANDMIVTSVGEVRGKLPAFTAEIVRRLPKSKNDLATEKKEDTFKKFTDFLPHYITVGSSFSTPLLIVSVYNNYYLLDRKMFFDYGCDFGFFHGMQDINDVNYYSFYPNLHINGNIPGDNFQLHGGLGIGYMISTYTFPNDTVNMNTFAFDVGAGFDISIVTIGYNLRTDFKSINHKTYVGIRIPY